jgi:Flp pilus assembly protein TadG
MNNTMRYVRRGQSLVEFALILPLLLLLIFGIIDFSYYIYGWATTQFAVSRGAQQAATLPPVALKATYSDAEIVADSCLGLIYDQTKAGTTGFTPENNEITFRWISIRGTTETEIPTNVAPPVSRNTIIVPNTIVEVAIVHKAAPLTPLARTVFGGKDFEFRARARRTIMNIDVGPFNNCESP